MTDQELEKLRKQLQEVNNGKLINSPGWGVIRELIETIDNLKNKQDDLVMEMENLDG